MVLRLTDEEIAAVGSVANGWPWGISTVPEGGLSEAVSRGWRSMIVRELVSEKGISGPLAEIVEFLGARRVVASVVVGMDGRPSLPTVQVFFVQRMDGRWLRDLRVSIGIHSLEVVRDNQEVLRYLEKLCTAYVGGREKDSDQSLALLSSKTGVKDGLVVAEDVRRAVRDGSSIGSAELLAEDSANADWNTLLTNLIS